MAIDHKQPAQQKVPTQQSNWLVGFNVILMVVLSVALVGGLQWIGLTRLGRVDVTSSGVNSLTEPTQALLKGIDQKVTLTSLYFETDIEDKDQDRYRSAVNDLLELYEVSNRSQISFESINPLQDQDKRSEVLKRLAGRSLYKEQAEGHVAVIQSFQDEFAGRITSMLSDELNQIQSLGQLEGNEGRLTAQVKDLFDDLGSDIKSADQQIKDSLASDVPAYSAATGLLRQTYSSIRTILESITAAGAQVSSKPDDFSAPVLQFFSDAGSRYDALITDLKAQEEAIGTLPTLDLDQIVRDIASATGNPILVETENRAQVIPFRKVWPPANPQLGAARFEDRMFQGEQTVTSAILQLTQN